MQGRASSSEKQDECNGGKVRFGPKGKKAAIVVSFALVLAAFLGAGMLGNGSDPGQTLGIGTAGDLEYSVPLDMYVMAVGDVDTSGGGFTLEGGYIYKIELRGGAGTNGGDRSMFAGGAGGDGAVLVIWIDISGDAPTVTYDFTYDIVYGGAGGSVLSGMGRQGGAGGNAVFLYDDINIDPIAVAAGGGGGGGAANATNGFRGSAANDDIYAGGWYGNAGDGTDGAHNAGGGGGGGAGIPGGDGGDGGATNAGGKGGKGGLSFIYDTDYGYFTFDVVNSGPEDITVIQYEEVTEYYVSGNVADKNGYGLQDAKVWYVYDGSPDEGFALTDSNGDYTIEAFGTQKVTIVDVTLTGYRVVTPMPGTFTTDSTGNDFVMRLVMPVTGTVTNYNSGLGIEGVTITYTLYDETSAAIITDATLDTEADGTFSIDALEDYTVDITDVSKTNHRLHYAYTFPMTFDAGDNDADFEMDAMTTIKGTVKGNDGIGLNGVDIKYTVNSGSESTETTAADGSYTISGIFENDDIQIISVELSGYRAKLSYTFPMAVDAGVDDADFIMDAATTVTGTVKDNGGVGIDGVTISFTVNTASATPVATVTDGSYTISGIFETDVIHILSLSKTDYRAKLMYTFPMQLDAGDTGVDFVMDYRSTVTGTVKGNDGVGIDGVTITYKVNNGTSLNETTATDGSFTIAGIFENDVIVITGVTKLDYRVKAGTVPATFDAGDNDADFVMDYKSTVTGTVKNTGGTGLSGVTVTYTVNNGSSLFVTTATDGSFLIYGIFETDVVRITSVVLSGYIVDATLPAAFNAGADNADFLMLKYIVISGTVVYNVNGSAVPSFVLQYRVNGAAPVSVDCYSGSYSITVVERQNVALTVVLNGYKVSGGTAIFDNIASAKTHEFRMLKEFELIGTVVCGDAPLEDVTVTYKKNGGTEMTAKTDANGVYRISNLIEGDEIEILGVELEGYRLVGEIPGKRGLGTETVNFEMAVIEEPSSSTMWYLIVAVILILAAVVVYFFFFRK